MSQQDGIAGFSRQDLRKSSKFVEGDYSGINPRQFYRRLKRELEEIQKDGDFKYTTKGDQSRNLSVSSEEVGSKTGTIEGRMEAESDWEHLGSANLDYRPYGHYGAGAIILGVITLVYGLANVEFLAVGLAILGAGYYGYSQTERAEYDIVRQDQIRVLKTGEVSERTVDQDGETRTDMFANMSVVFAGDSFIAIETGSIDSHDSQFRRRLLQHVKELHNEVVDSPQEEVTVESGFTWHMNGLSSDSAQEHAEEIDRIQSRLLAGPFEYRVEYSDVLKTHLPPGVKDDVESREENLLVELQDLSDNLDIYVEREGLEHQNNLSDKTSSGNRQLETGEK